MGDQFDGPPVKRYRRDMDPTNPDPSIVVHVRNLNPKATEAHLLEALSHFGGIAYATCMPKRRMALVEFEELEGARSCVVFAQTNQIHVAGQTALFNYSTSKAIQRLGLESETPNHVLILTISNVQYPINVDVIHTCCKSHGEVRRISINRGTLLQALVEFDKVDSAKAAKRAMNGADIYSGCCTLKAEYAKPDSVKVTRNDQDQRDFTTPADQPPGAHYEPKGRKSLLGPAQDQQHGGMPPGPNFGPPMMPPQVGPGPGFNFSGPAAPQQGGGTYMGGGGYHAGGGYMAGGGGAGYQGVGGYQQDNRDKGFSNQQPYNDNRDRGGPMSARNDMNSPVLMVYGVDQEKINCDQLFNILCLYGNCLRIKFMKSKPNTAMAQLQSSQEVHTAIENLNGAFVLGNKLTLEPSKQMALHETREPFNMPDGSPAFQDYSASRNQRFSTPQSAARNRLVRPTNVLHWCNAPANMNEQKMAEIFTSKGMAAPVKVTMFPSRSEVSSSGVCHFSTIEQATDALVKCNHTPVDSPLANAKAPYIVKLAFAIGRDGTNFQ